MLLSLTFLLLSTVSAERVCTAADTPRTFICGASANASEIELQIAPKKAASLRVELADGNGTWSFETTPGTTLVKLPRGAYRVTVESPHFTRSRHEVVASETRTVIAAELHALPVLSGTVLVRATGEPMAGALVTSDDGELSALTDARGRFALEADPEQWPETLTVHAVPYSSVSINIPTARANTTLAPVRLTTARAIHVTTTAPAAAVRQIELRKLDERRRTETIRTTAFAERLTFDDLPPATYLVVAKGEHPWQQRAEKIDLGVAADAAVSLHVEPFPFHLATTFDGEPLGGATVRLQNANFWETEIETNDEGVADLELWQGGRFAAVVLSTAVNAPFTANEDIVEGEDDEWTIAIPNREITGVVVDARSGEPVPSPLLSLNVASAEGPITFTATGDEHGRFRIVPVHHGKHTLRVAAKNRPPVEVTYLFNDPEERRHVTVRLGGSSTVRVRVSDARGHAVAGARAIQFHDGIRMEGRTDASGVIDVWVPDEGVCDLYVVPRDGSFTVMRLGGDAQNATLTIPDGVSRIVLRAQREDERPLENMPLRISYNGHALPRDVVEAIAVVQGARMHTDATGTLVLERMPPGVYDFAGVRVNVAAGENVAVMRFAR